MHILMLDDRFLASNSPPEGLFEDGFASAVIELGGQKVLCLQTENLDDASFAIGFPASDDEITIVMRMSARQAGMPILLMRSPGTSRDNAAEIDAARLSKRLAPLSLELKEEHPAPVLETRAPSRKKTLKYHDLVVDLGVHTAEVRRCPLNLTCREWLIASELVARAPNVVSKKQLVKRLASLEKDISPNGIEVHISRLRRKLASHGILVTTRRGFGYAIADPRYGSQALEEVEEGPLA